MPLRGGLQPVTKGKPRPQCWRWADGRLFLPPFHLTGPFQAVNRAISWEREGKRI